MPLRSSPKSIQKRLRKSQIQSRWERELETKTTQANRPPPSRLNASKGTKPSNMLSMWLVRATPLLTESARSERKHRQLFTTGSERRCADNLNEIEKRGAERAKTP